MTQYQTVREAKKSTGLSEHYLRKLVRAGKAPGVYSGSRFLLNVPALLAQLDQQSRDRMERAVIR